MRQLLVTARHALYDGGMFFSHVTTMTSHALYCELTHEGVLSVQGPDASKFLQGQVTCNLSYLSPNQSSLGARCTAKGRMLSSFQVVAIDDGYLLALDTEL